MAVAAVIAGAAAAYSIGSGIVKANKAKKEAQQLQKTRPKYQNSPYAGQGVSLAQSELSRRGSEFLDEQADQDLSSSLDTILKSGGSSNDVASLFTQNSIGRARVAMMRDNLRLNQIANLSRAQETAEEDRQRQFGFNEVAPWKDAASANAAAKEQAQAQIQAGVTSLASTGASYASSVAGANQLNDYFKVPASTSGVVNKYSAPSAEVVKPNTGNISPASNYLSIH